MRSAAPACSPSSSPASARCAAVSPCRMLCAWVMMFLRSVSAFSSPAAGPPRRWRRSQRSARRCGAACRLRLPAARPAAVWRSPAPGSAGSKRQTALRFGHTGPAAQVQRGLVRPWLSCWPWMESSPAEISRTTPAVAGIPLMRQLPLPSALISRYKSRSSAASYPHCSSLALTAAGICSNVAQMQALAAPLRTSSREVRLPKMALMESIRSICPRRSHRSER